jgi:hypothetical protein
VSTAILAAERAVIPGDVSVLRKVLSFPVMLSSLLSMLAVLTVRAHFNDPDMWWHLKTGQIIWTTHAIPTTDVFSYTTNHHSWVPHEWLSQAIIYGAYVADGYTGLMLWLCFLTIALMLTGYALCSLYSGNAKAAFVGAMTIWLFATAGVAIRPQMIGYLLLTLELIVIHLGRTRDSRWFFCLPPLFAVWVNCHGSFFLGLILGGVFLFCSFFNFRLGSLVALHWERRSQKFLAVSLLLSTAALFLNPVGAKQVFYPLNIMLHQPGNLAYVYEWLPLQMNQSRGIGLMAVLGCILLLVIVRRSELFWDELVVLSLGTWLAVSHQRMAFVFGILAAPILSRLLSTCWDGYDIAQDLPFPNAVLIVISMLVAFWGFPNRQNLAKQIDEGSPTKAVEFIRDHHISGNMLNEYAYGGFLIWRTPEHPVFVDGNADTFEWTGVLAEYVKWTTLQSDPNTLLNKYKVDFCLLDRTSPMARVFPLLPNWKPVYSDDHSVMFVRRVGTTPLKWKVAIGKTT